MSGSVNSSPASSLTPLMRLPRRVEVDINATISDQTVRAQGDVFLNRTVLPNAVRSALHNVSQLHRVDLGFDSTSQRYTVSAQVQALGLTVPLSASTGVHMDGQTIVLSDTQFHAPAVSAAAGVLGGLAGAGALAGLSRLAGLPLRGGRLGLAMAGAGLVAGYAATQLLPRVARSQIASAMQHEGINASTAGTDIRIDGSSLLHEAGVLPYWANLDPNLQAQVQHDQAGNVRLHLGDGPAGEADGSSHISARVDTAAGQHVLHDLFNSGQYTVSRAVFAPGHVEVQGRTTIPEVRATVNELAGPVVALLGGGLGTLLGGNEPMSRDFSIPLNMDVRAQGSNVVVRPSLHAAVQPVATSLRTDRVQPEVHGDDVSVSASSMLPDGQVDQLTVDQDGMRIEAHINADAFLGENMKAE